MNESKRIKAIPKMHPRHPAPGIHIEANVIMDGGNGPWTDKSGPTGGRDELNEPDNINKNNMGRQFKPK